MYSRTMSHAPETTSPRSTGSRDEGHPTDAHPGQVEDVVDQRQQVLGAAVDGVEVAPIGSRQRLAVALRRSDDHLAEADDEVQGCSELVADVGDELRLRTLGRLGCLASQL